MRKSSLFLLFSLVVSAFSVGCGSGDSTPAPAAGTPDSKSAASSDAPPAGEAVELLNVSYDPTRELWKSLNDAFTAKQTAAGKNISIKQSHGGSGSQARAVIDGLDADVVTLAMWADTDQIRKKGLIKDGWEDALPNRSLPYTSTIVFVVR